MSYMGRVKGSSRTEYIRPRVELLSHTENPIGTLFSLWHGSRFNEFVDSAQAQAIYEGKDSGLEELKQYIVSCYPEYGTASRVVQEVARMNLLANVPSAESVTFNFAIHDCSVGLREQIVRSKLSSYWTQTSRTADLRYMDIHMSNSIEEYGGQEAVDIYKHVAETIREGYRKLADLGVPLEEVRLAPEARVHRVMWMTDTRALMLVINKRLDWMAQTTLWTPIIEDMVQILRNIDPMLGDFFGNPPGVKIQDGKVIHHAYDNENEDRYYGRDLQPVDPLWLAYKGIKPKPDTNFKLYDQMKSYYIKLWSDEILEVLGWDRENPDKLGYYDRP